MSHPHRADPHTEHPSRRLVITLPQTYGDAIADYQRLIPEFVAHEFAACASWQDHIDLARTKAPHGFMRYHQIDMAPLMRASGAAWKATQYLMGNHTIAARMFRYDPEVMLHAPLRTLLFDDPDGRTKLAVDQPSLLFDSYHNNEISSVGNELDEHLSRLITLLGGTVPTVLAESL